MDLKAQIRAGLQSQGFPILPSPDWIQTALLNRTPVPPLPALIASAKARLLAADLTKLDPGPGSTSAARAAFPPALAAQVQVREARLPRDVVVQVLDVENLSRSKWEQVEELEAVARGEQTRGREVVRLPVSGGANDDDGVVVDGDGPTQQQQQPTPAPSAARAGGAGAGFGGGSGSGVPRNATHRFVLQDCSGQKVHGLELKRLDRSSPAATVTTAGGAIPPNIGEKILLREGAVVARGVVLLDPATCSVLGGKVEAWQRAWVDDRLVRLKEAVGIER